LIIEPYPFLQNFFQNKSKNPLHILDLQSILS